jgi:hypothetical protein
LVIAAYPFQPVAMIDGPAGDGDLLSGFQLTVPASDNLAGLRLVGPQGQTLAEKLQPSPAAALKLGGLALAPAAQGAPPGGPTVQWQPAGSDVVYRVRYSPDGGQTWQVLALGLPGNSFTLPAGLAEGGAQPLVEVQAADGLHTATQVLTLNH